MNLNTNVKQVIVGKGTRFVGLFSYKIIRADNRELIYKPPYSYKLELTAEVDALIYCMDNCKGIKTIIIIT